jgi:hypothetical protein
MPESDTTINALSEAARILGDQTDGRAPELASAVICALTLETLIEDKHDLDLQDAAFRPRILAAGREVAMHAFGRYRARQLAEKLRVFATTFDSVH